MDPPTIDARGSFLAKTAQSPRRYLRILQFLTSASAVEFEDVEPAVVVGAVDQAAGIDEDVGGLDHLRAIRPVVDHARRRRRHQRANFLGPIWVADVEHAHSRVLIGGKGQFRAYETARPVLVDIMRAEMAALMHVV